MKSLLFSLFATCLFATPVFSGPAEEKLRERCLKPTIFLFAPKDYSAGSAFVVKSEAFDGKFHNVAITAWHCTLSEPYVVRVPNYDNKGELLGYKVYPTHVYASLKKSDLAVVLFESDEKIACVELEMKEPLEFGQKVFHIGFGLGDDARLDDGKITSVSVKSPKSFNGLIRTNVYTVFGDSGGPLFNSKRKVVGVCHAVRALSSTGMPLFNQSYYVPISWLKTWDDEVNNVLSFVYMPKAKLPVMAYARLKLEQFEIGAKDNAKFHIPFIGIKW